MLIPILVNFFRKVYKALDKVIGFSYIIGDKGREVKSTKLPEITECRCTNCPLSRELVSALEEDFLTENPVFVRTDEELAKTEQSLILEKARAIEEAAKRGEV